MPHRPVPAWALNHLNENLPRHATLLNVAVHRRGVVVANTRIGAAVVTKGWLGEPRMQLLANPRESTRFDCQVCGEHLEFRRLDLPNLVHCGICGSRYEVDRAGLAEIRERRPWTGVPAAPPAVPTTSPVQKEPTPAPSTGPFTYNGYTLYTRQVELKSGGKPRTIYFFAKRTPKSGTAIAKPDGFHVGVNGRTGLPFLKRGAAKDGEDLTPHAEPAYRPQCAALTEAGGQCRNSARAESKYCASHFGYQPPSIAKAEAQRKDTLPRVRMAADTKPSVRRKATAT